MVFTRKNLALDLEARVSATPQRRGHALSAAHIVERGIVVVPLRRQPGSFVRWALLEARDPERRVADVERPMAASSSLLDAEGVVARHVRFLLRGTVELRAEATGISAGLLCAAEPKAVQNFDDVTAGAEVVEYRDRLAVAWRAACELLGESGSWCMPCYGLVRLTGLANTPVS